MDVWMIWAETAGYHWLVEAWDDETRNENSTGWNEAVAKATKDHENIRIVRTSVDFNAIVKTFEVPLVESGPIEVEQP